jgi:hypothetical protein
VQDCCCYLVLSPPYLVLSPFPKRDITGCWHIPLSKCIALEYNLVHSCACPCKIPPTSIAQSTN